jgi:hypothetical protein
MSFFYSNSGGGGGGVQLSPLATSATSGPIVPATGDYEDGEFGGMMIGRGKRSTRKRTTPVPLSSPQISHELTGREPGKSATNRLSYGTAYICLLNYHNGSIFYIYQ